MSRRKIVQPQRRRPGDRAAASPSGACGRRPKLGGAPHYSRESATTTCCRQRHPTGDPKGALEDAETALALNPRLPEALLERGILRFEAGDKKAARADLIQVRLIAPDSAAAISAGLYIEKMDVKSD